MPDGRGAARARVILWPTPFQKTQPRAVDAVTAGEDGAFRFEDVTAGKYILSATRSDGNELLLGETLPSDAPPVALPDQAAGCTLQFTIRPQTLYTVRGKTSPGPGRTARMILKDGDAIPFEQSAPVQSDGWYEFRVPAVHYQFFAGSTGSGFEVSGNIDDIGIGILWPKADGRGSGMPEMGVEFNESMTRVKLMVLGEAQRTYEKTYHRGFSADLASLGPPPEWLRATKDYAGLMSGFGTFVKLDNNCEYVEFDYLVTYTPGPADEAGKIATFIISARPVRFGKTGNRSFLLDESGVMRATSADRPASKDDSEATQ